MQNSFADFYGIVSFEELYFCAWMNTDDEVMDMVQQHQNPQDYDDNESVDLDVSVIKREVSGSPEGKYYPGNQNSGGTNGFRKRQHQTSCG